ncbi:MAG: hypothetical protein GY757_49750, partial [bacterium]|nr:hypothetical protein [bacterium]
AALTADVKRYALVATAILFSGILLNWTIYKLSPLIGLVDFRLLFMEILFPRAQFLLILEILICIGILLHQYLTSKTGRSVVLISVVLMLVAAYNVFFVWNSINIKESKEKQAAPQNVVNLLVDDDPRIRDFKLLSKIENTGSFSRQGRIDSSFSAKYKGIPGEYFVTLRALKDVTLLHRGDRMKANLHLVGSTDIDSKREVLWNKFMPSKFSGAKDLELKVVGIPEAEFRRFCPAIATLTAQIDLDLCGYEIVGKVPLKKGSRCKKDSEFLEVTGLVVKPSGCSVSVEIQDAGNDHFSKRDVEIVLHNKKRDEILIRDFRDGGNCHIKQLPGKGLVKIVQDLIFSLERGTNQIVETIDRAWLKDAELVFLKQKVLGRVSKPLRVEKLVLPMNEALIAKQKFSRVTLTDNSDAARVEAYIRQLLIAFLERNGRRFEDIESDMLAKVGPGHIQLLGDMGILYDSKSYTMQAIKRIAGPESKEQILNILEDYYNEHSNFFDIVCREGWDEELMDFLKEKLESEEAGDYLVSWVKNGCCQPDRSLYPLIKSTFMKLGNSYRCEQVFPWVKDLPGIDISDILPTLWTRNKHRNDDLTAAIIPSVMASGFPDALEVAVRLAGSNDLCNCHDLWPNIRRYTDFKGKKKDIYQWYEQNKDRIKFDKKTNKYLIR